jgi:phosphoribosylanthranilate isomerase
MPVFVKICGLASPGAVSAAIGHDADMLGFHFCGADALTPEKAATLVTAIPSGMDRVGVFADADDAFIGRVLAQAPLDLLELAGDETPARARQIRDTFRLPLIKALRNVGNAGAFDGIADWLLFDVGNRWAQLRDYRARRPWLLAGELDATNVQRAVAESGAPAVSLHSDGGAGDIRALLAATTAIH